MKAIRIHDYGDASVLRYEEAPVPEIRADAVLVRIHSAGVNPVDWKIRAEVAGSGHPAYEPRV